VRLENQGQGAGETGGKPGQKTRRKRYPFNLGKVFWL